MRGEVRAGRRHRAAAAQAACRTGRAPTYGCGGRARAERTTNMRFMSVTLDVSKLRGWLNTDARCRVERRACNAGRGAGREAAWSGGGASGACTGKARLNAGGHGTRGERT